MFTNVTVVVFFGRIITAVKALNKRGSVSLPPLAVVTHCHLLPAVTLVVSDGTCWESKAE
jgi:hypothetical protein